MEEKLKILLVAPYHAVKVGGIGTWTKNLFDYSVMHPNDFECIFQNTAFLWKSHIQGGNWILSRIIWGGIDSLRILLQLIVNLLLRRPDVVHYTSSASFALIKDRCAVFLCHLFGVPMIVHWRFGRIPEIFTSKGKEYRLLKNVLYAVDWNYVLDQASLETLQKAGITNVELLANPVSLTIAQKLNHPALPSEKRKDIVFLGHVVPAKGVVELVSACVELPEVHCLKLIGPYEKCFQEQLVEVAAKREQGRWLEFIGEIPREKVLEYLSNCSIMALPSYTEGFPNAVLESMALGCPTVATAVGAIREMLSCDSDSPCGTCVTIRDSNSLRKALQTMLAHPEMQQMFADNGRKKVLQEYHPDIIFPRLVQRWHDISGKK